jgi:hypothetical protein
MRAWCAYGSGWHRSAALSILLVSAISGCGKSSATVTGHVRYQGQAVTAGTVAFYGPDNQLDTAVIKSDGSYTATKVPLGPVKVTVSTPQPMSERMVEHLQKMKKGQFTPPPKTVAVPPKYGKADKSGLELTVEKGSQPFEIDLK